MIVCQGLKGNTMEEKDERFGNFSSSNIYRLVGLGKRNMTTAEIEAEKKIKPKSRKRVIYAEDTPDDKFYTYVKEKQRESKLKRGINTKAYTRPIIWGVICELYVFEHKLDITYSNMNNVGRLFHPEISNFTGIPDTFIKKDKIVGDIKCPSSLIKFCDLVENTNLGLQKFKENHSDYYWQLVSNTILTGAEKAELLFYVPYLSEMVNIRDFVENIDENQLPYDMEIHQVEWIVNEINAYVEFGKLPLSIAYLPNDSDYKDFNKFTFEVPRKDILFLENRIKKAVKLLLKNI